MIYAILLLMFVPVDSQPENCTYIMTVPKVTRPGTDIDICITVWKKGSGNVNIAAVLRNNNGKTISGISKTYAGVSGKLQIIKLKVPGDAPSGYDYHLDTISTGWIVFYKTPTRSELTQEMLQCLYRQIDQYTSQAILVNSIIYYIDKHMQKFEQI
ncbi:unnamed protein product [Mytilus edulis]|uniref:Uncharacterized protein n=1 Tax=Mytilus edulis TaxID=6550 RepID=A0A8S3QFH1_MYTED|nr:unnamed protein product [Mytilus edulis]